MRLEPLDLPRPCFDFLTNDLGFKVDLAERSPQFDNAVVVLQRTDLLLRFSRDRGDIYIEVSPNAPTKSWIDLNLLRNVMLGLRLDTDANDSQLATFLQTDFSAIRTHFTDKQIDATRKTIEAAAYERLRQKFPGAVEEQTG